MSGNPPTAQHISTKGNTSHGDGLRILLAEAAAEGVTVVGIFVGLNNSHESRWEYLRSPSEGVPTPLRLSAFELLPEEEGPVDGG